MAASFGVSLASHRRARGLSQQQLAELAGVSQRHISFLESGRSSPGSKALRKLFQAMALTKYQVDQLLGLAGLVSPTSTASNAQLNTLDDVHHLLSRILDKHEPYPALAYQRDGAVLKTNVAMERLLHKASPRESLWHATCSLGRRNIYDLTLHPLGLRRFMRNPQDIVPHTYHRLRVAALTHPSAAITFQRAKTYSDNLQLFGLHRSEHHCSFITEQYCIGKTAFALVSAVTCLGSPEDETAQNIQIETFFPADEATHTFLVELSRKTSKLLSY
jgi:transcriptional regulator with XRE-family HTH domain